MERIKKHFEQASSLLQVFLSDEQNFYRIEEAGKILTEALSNGNKVISCGNGGSMCDAIHFAEELTGRYRDDRKPLAAMAISDPGYLSCVANDYGYSHIFSRMVEAMGKSGDVLLAISTSGNSENVLSAIKSAKQKGMKVIGLTGKNGGEMASVCDVEIRAPYSDYADRAQEIHIKIIHSLIDYIEKNI